MLFRLNILLALVMCAGALHGQDSATANITALPAKYLETVSSKSDKYYNSITGKTEKTLTKLAKWESKIKTILEKASPETAQRLFGNNQLTFAALLQKYKEGKAAADNYKGKYDEYRDKVTTTVKYVSNEYIKYDKYIKGGDTSNKYIKYDKYIGEAAEKTTKLNEQLRNTEAVQEFIKERKKQLMQQGVKYLSNNKYIKKISKESYYYVQTLANYKEIFSDPKKTEELAMKLLQKIPAFNEFMRKNSMLASLFRMPGGSSDPAAQASLAGLQTRASVNNLIQQQIAAGGPNAQQQFQQNMQAAQSQLNELKNKIIKAGGSSSDDLTPDPSPRGGEGGFRPNNQKSKTFLQRLELSTNVQTQSARYYFPVTSDLGLSVGYKLNDKSIIGIGASYKLGWGTGWNNIKLTQQGAGIRSFVDWKIKGSFWISGGFEMNLTPGPSPQGGEGSSWSRSGLLGISKSVPVKTKFFKKTKVQLLVDFLSFQQVPKAQPIIFRVGYNF